VPAVLFLKGMFCGLVIAAPVGPVGILTVKRTLQAGLRVGLLSGLGAATADAIYGIVAAFGLHFVADFMLDHSWWLRLAGGVLMVGIGVYELLRPLPEPGRRRPITVNSIAGWYGTTFLLTITNPITILSFGAVFILAEAVVPQGDLSAAWTLIAGVFCGSALWFGSLSGFSRMFRRGIDVQGLRLVSRVSGVAVILFGVVVLLSLTPLARRTFGY
jgi:threonine/homoserine/homoserine lactone efflux protein